MEPVEAGDSVHIVAVGERQIGTESRELVRQRSMDAETP